MQQIVKNRDKCHAAIFLASAMVLTSVAGSQSTINEENAMEMLLKAFTPAISDDGRWTKLALEGDNGKQVNVTLMSNDFGGMLDSLITFHIQSEVGKALA